MAFDPSLVPTANKLHIALDSSQIASDLTDFPVAIQLDSSNPLHAPIFADLVPRADDDFTGTGGDAPKTELWSIYHSDANAGDTSGVMSIQGNRLDVNISNANTWPIVYSNYSIAGDFDVELDWGIDSIPAIDSNWAMMFSLSKDLTFLSTDAFSAARYAPPNGPNNCYVTTGGVLESAITGTYEGLSGRFRIERIGNTAKIYSHNGTDWVLELTKVGCYTGEVRVLLSGRTWNIRYLDGYFDNFTINSGTVIGLPPNNKKISVDFNGTQCPVEIESWGDRLSQFIYADTNPTHHWTMDSISGTTLTAELGPVDGTISNMVGTDNGKFDRYLAGGVHVSAAKQTIFDTGVPFKSFSMWIRRVDISKLSNIARSVTDKAIGVRSSSDGNANALYFNPGTTQYSNLAITDTSWHHLVVVEGTDANHHWFYIDSVKASAEIESGLNGYIARLGTSYFSTAYDTVDFDNVQAYDYTLSDAEIQALYESQVVTATLHTKVPTYSSSVDTGLLLSWDASQADNIDYVGDAPYAVVYSGVPETPSADWINATNLSLTDQLITYSEVVVASPLLRAVLEQHWGLLNQHLRQVLDQDYHLTNHFIAELVQVYGLRLLGVLVQLYGNSPRHRAKLAQHYGDCGLLRRILSQEYGDAARYRAMFDQEWNMQEGLRQAFVQRYSISEASYRSLCDQQYDLAELDLLRAQLDQLYVLAAGEALVQRMDQSVVCGGVTHTSAYNIFLEQDEALYYMVGELQIADELEYLQYVAYETEVVITVDGESYSFIVDGYPRKSRAPGNNSFVVPLASSTILLQIPHSKVTANEFVGMASVLVAGLAAPYAVDWRLVDWFIPAGILTGTGESAISIIKKIVVAAGGLVQTSPAGTLICRPEYPVSVNEWSTATPDIELTDQDDFFQIAPTPSLRDGYNVFYLSNQSLAGDTFKMDVEKLSSSTAQIDVYQQPWDETVRFNMDHSGGWWVSVIAEGVTIEEVTGQVEIVGGSGQTSKPVMEYVSHIYSEADLGDVTVDEAGNVTTEILENSLLQLTYKKRYWRFLATDMNIEDVQFFPVEVAA